MFGYNPKFLSLFCAKTDKNRPFIEKYLPFASSACRFGLGAPTRHSNRPKAWMPLTPKREQAATLKGGGLLSPFVLRKKLAH
jgi:hypothetical protein